MQCMQGAFHDSHVVMLLVHGATVDVQKKFVEVYGGDSESIPDQSCPVSSAIRTSGDENLIDGFIFHMQAPLRKAFR